ncbi:MAG: FAD:protein FMN transferase [Nitratireductor sp.]|nr:FAD:protein FMN transferase [Nitratireductor sp.]
MSLSRRRFIAISASAAATGLSSLAANAAGMEAGTGARWRGVALGAEADIRLVGLPRQQAERLLEQVRAEITRLEDEFSLYRADSALSRLNRDGRLDQPGGDMLSLLGLVSAMHAASGGRFDPTVQPVWDAYARAAGRPVAAQLTAARRRVGWRHVEIDAAAIRLAEGCALTLNGIAQGYVTDRAVALLRQAGLENALVEVGEISAMGRPDKDGFWQVHLGSSGGPMVEVSDRAVATSAADGTLIGEGVSHLIDPATGLPCRSKWLRTSVIHLSAAIADAASTATSLMELDEIRTMMRHLGGASFVGLHSELGHVSLAHGDAA